MQQQKPQQALAYRPKGYGRGQIDKPQPILGHKPPLPGANQPVVVNFAQTKESTWEQIQALVPIVPYVEEASSSSLTIFKTIGSEGLPPMHPPQLDVENLLFLACGNMRPQRLNQADKRGCFKCGAEDHWQRECPHDKK